MAFAKICASSSWIDPDILCKDVDLAQQRTLRTCCVYVLDMDFAALVFGVLAACGRAGSAQGRAKKQSGWSKYRSREDDEIADV